MAKPFLLVATAVFFAAIPAYSPAVNPGAQDNAQPQATAPAMPPAQTVPAPAPMTYPKNPFKPTAESQAKAKTLYSIDCSMCHGDNGNGKTDLATSMDLTLLDWTDPKALSNRQDGELFNIIRNGKDKMPPETDGRASDELVWNLVVYVRGFSKGSASASAGASK
jgi:mono/diheme cytochrome c family protein